MKRMIKMATTWRKPAKTAKKKAGKTAKTPRKRLKKGGSDTMRATMLTGVLLVMAAVISICVVNYYKNETTSTQDETFTAREKKKGNLKNAKG
ncbi:hypothetical protein [Treponema sp. R6D11]